MHQESDTFLKAKSCVLYVLRSTPALILNNCVMFTKHAILVGQLSEARSRRKSPILNFVEQLQSSIEIVRASDHNSSGYYACNLIVNSTLSNYKLQQKPLLTLLQILSFVGVVCCNLYYFRLPSIYNICFSFFSVHVFYKEPISRPSSKSSLSQGPFLPYCSTKNSLKAP